MDINIKKRILITGGNGLVGSAIKDILNREDIKENYKNYQFTFTSSQWGNLEKQTQTFDIFKSAKPDYVIHLAAFVGGLFKNMQKKVEMFEKNIQINMNVIKACHKFNVKKLICCLSTCIFPDNTTYPINESMLHNGAPHDSNNAYAYAKRMMEIQCKIYNEQFGTNFMCIIPTNIYGPHDNFSIKDGHVIPGLIHKCYLAKKDDKRFEIYGTGKPLRQFLFSYDLAEIILRLLFEYKNNDSIIISPSEENTIFDTALFIKETFQYNNDIFFNSDFSDGQFKKTADNSKLIKLFPDIKFTPLSDGISQTVHWFNKHYSNCRK